MGESFALGDLPGVDEALGIGDLGDVGESLGIGRVGEALGLRGLLWRNRCGTARAAGHRRMPYDA
ncbi:MAG: hypothetical protein DIU78_019665 [Pseudomonadota bacterium]|nr:MAG: hypothetical protein DIU78_25265 [Pseudomonadota bacterium]